MSRSTAESPIVFVNIGWMKRYHGPSPSDRLYPGNFAYFKKAKRIGKPRPIPVGHEQWNFFSQSGWVYGYVPRSARINLRRLGAPPGASEVTNVTVVFVARDPAANVLLIVGWYTNATVANDLRFVRRYGRTRVETSIAVRAGEAHLVHVGDRRPPVIPTAQTTPGGIGQSPVWYADHQPALIRKVRDLIANSSKRKPRPWLPPPGAKPPMGGPRNQDPVVRLKVEETAMDWAMAYFDKARNVASLKRGWDIEAASALGTLLIEVKGLAGPRLVIELTPNEYEMMGKHKERYVLFVLTSALSHRPLARIFRYEAPVRGRSEAQWLSERGDVLDIRPRVGAVCSL